MQVNLQCCSYCCILNDLLSLFRAKCNYTAYSVESATTLKMDWQTDWLSELHIIADSDILEIREEYLSFDFSDFMSSVGGYLGKV